MAGMPRKVRATTNPYGIGHNWLKMRFQLPGMAHKVIREPGEPERVAIFGYLAENKILLKGDPDYLSRIKRAARDPAELEAWVNGSWDIVAGGMFDDVWDPKVHVVEPFPIPHSWKIDRSFDWGSSKPFSVGWWAESDGSIAQTSRGPLHTVRGDLFRIHEWYGWTGKANEGLRMTAGQIAAGIVERELQWGIHDRVVPGAADASIFDEENDNCIADDMAEPVKVNGAEYSGVAWEPADKSPGSRKQGWEQLRKRFQNSARKHGEPREHPGLFVFRGRCPQFLRTVPILPRDDRDLDDVDTDAEDHCGDEVRYRVRWTPGAVAGVW